MRSRVRRGRRPGRRAARTPRSRDQQVDLGVRERSRRALGGELQGDRGAGGVVARAGHVVAAQLALGEHASEKARPASAIAAQRHAAPGKPAQQRAGGEREAEDPGYLQSAARGAARPRDGTSGRTGSSPCARTRQTRRARRPPGAMLATRFDAGRRESSVESGVKRRSPSSAASAVRGSRDRRRPRADARALEQPAGQRRAEEQAVGRGEGRVAAVLLERRPPPRARAASRQRLAGRRSAAEHGRRGPMSEARSRITPSASAVGGGRCVRAPWSRCRTYLNRARHASVCESPATRPH